MKKNFRHTALAAVLALGTGAALAQAFPSKPVTLHIPYPAGGPTDVLGRTLASAMEKNLKQTVVVENTGGGGGTIGTSKVARAPADGHTVLLNNLGMATTPTLYRKLPYSPDDLAPVGIVATVPMVIVARNSLPVPDMKAFVAHIKANSTKVNMGHSGVGSAAHLCGLMLQSALQTKITPIAYRGAALAMNDMIGDQFDFMCEQVSSSWNFVTTGKVKGLAVTSKQPLAILPGVPTTASAGIPTVDVGVWHGLWVPKGTPAPVVDRISASLAEALKDPEVQKKFGELSAVPAAAGETTPAALKKLQDAEMARWAPIIKAAAEYAD